MRYFLTLLFLFFSLVAKCENTFDGKIKMNIVLKAQSDATELSRMADAFSTTGSTTSIGLIRPDVCAPGVNIKSLDFNTTNGYCLKSGTSMATPCVTGAIALLLSKDHELTPAQIDEILECTAIPLSTHKSNDFGSGRIDALAAVNAVGDDGIEEISGDNILVYPNPASDFITIAETVPETAQILLMNVHGQLMNVHVKDNRIDISNLPAGIYLMKIDDQLTKIVVKP